MVIKLSLDSQKTMGYRIHRYTQVWHVLGTQKHYCYFTLELTIFASDGEKKPNFRELEGSVRSHLSSLWHIGPEAPEMSCPPLPSLLCLSS